MTNSEARKRMAEAQVAGRRVWSEVLDLTPIDPDTGVDYEAGRNRLLDLVEALRYPQGREAAVTAGQLAAALDQVGSAPDGGVLLAGTQVDRTRAHLLAEQRGILVRVREFHARWGDADSDDLDVLDLWETLGKLLDGGVR